jgi:hypothetical protein
MNNQFDNLMYAAGLTAQGCWDEMDEYDRNAILKFAELIVRECYEHCKDQLMDRKTAEEAGLTYNDGVMDCAIGLLQHFGVEESRREKFRKSFEEAFKGGVDLSGRETP